MKFGKRLKAEVERSSTRYSNHFIDYSALKLALKGDVQAQGKGMLYGFCSRLSMPIPTTQS